MVFFILSSLSTRPGPILKIPANNFHEIVDAGDKTLAQNCDFYDKCNIFIFFIIKNNNNPMHFQASQACFTFFFS